MSDTVAPEITPAALRETLGCFATGVAIVTGLLPDGTRVGLTISSFNSVSLTPPLVLWSIALGSPSRPAFAEGRPFVINILSGAQLDLCRRFSRPAADRFAGVETTTGPDGVPALTDNLATLSCVTERAIEAGDHELYIARVTDVSADRQRRPLIFHRSRLTELAVSP